MTLQALQAIANRHDVAHTAIVDNRLMVASHATIRDTTGNTRPVSTIDYATNRDELMKILGY